MAFPAAATIWAGPTLAPHAVLAHPSPACRRRPSPTTAACSPRPIPPPHPPLQVFCNSLLPTILAVAYGILAGCVDLPLGLAPTVEPWRAQALTGIMGGFLGYYACCCGDTWASELGPLSGDTPRLITTMRPVRRGTNGGVTLLGLSASIMGGMFIGLVFYLGGEWAAAGRARARACVLRACVCALRALCVCVGF